VSARAKLDPATCPVQPGQALAAAVATRVGAARFGLWFAGHARFIPLGHEVTVVVRNQQSHDWLEHAFGAAVREAVAEVCGPETLVRWAIDANLLGESPEGPPFQSERNCPSPTDARIPLPAQSALRESPHASQQQDPHQDLFGEPVTVARPARRRGASSCESVARPLVSPGRRWKSLAEFVVGACNRVAHASALSVVEEPGEGANPLIIHGPVGTGKTHLLEGIYAGLKRKGGDQRPVYVTAEEFTTRFVSASQQGKMGAFRRQFRECSTLLLDDLHFLATRKATQAEFLHTFDALIADGRQVVVTTDCHPRLADELMPELVDRLLGGAVWGLMPPDPPTRLEILRKKATGGTPPIPDSVLKLLASSLRGNVRELEGAVNSVRHYAKVTGRPVDQALVREALGDLLRHAVRVVSLADVDAAVCTTLRLAKGTLQSKSRAWSVTHPRMLAIYLCRKHTAATYGEISKYFGAKQHSTAVAAEKKVRAWIDTGATVAIGDRDWDTKELLDRIERELQR